MEEAYEIVGVVKDVEILRRPRSHRAHGLRAGLARRLVQPQPASSAPPAIPSAWWPPSAARRRRSIPSIPILQTLTMADQFDNSIAQERMLTTLCGFFGGLAVLLAAVGLYGVMAHSVTRRVREIGIRMALGRAGRRSALADPARGHVDGRDRRGDRPARGLRAHPPGDQLTSSGSPPQDPLSIAGSVVLLLAITAVAGLIPARRATRVDPMIALRYE